MPKKPNSEIREGLVRLGELLFAQADLLRGQATELDEIAGYLMDDANELHNAKPLKPRARTKSPRVTKAIARTIKTMAAMGIASDQIAAQFNINPGRVTDALNGKYD